MHPYSRPSPRTASPASNLQTNPTRTNNQRHNSQDMTAYSTTPPYSDRGAEESEGEMMSRGEPSSESRGQYHKVNQVIQVPIFFSHHDWSHTHFHQNFFTKSALAVISSRVSLPPAYNKDGKMKHNKWVCAAYPIPSHSPLTCHSSMSSCPTAMYSNANSPNGNSWMPSTASIRHYASTSTWTYKASATTSRSSYTTMMGRSGMSLRLSTLQTRPPDRQAALANPHRLCSSAGGCTSETRAWCSPQS